MPIAYRMRSQIAGMFFGDSFWGIRWDLWELVRLSTSRDQRVCIKGQADGEIGSMMDSGRRGRNLKIVSG